MFVRFLGWIVTRAVRKVATLAGVLGPWIEYTFLSVECNKACAWSRTDPLTAERQVSIREKSNNALTEKFTRRFIITASFFSAERNNTGCTEIQDKITTMLPLITGSMNVPLAA